MNPPSESAPGALRRLFPELSDGDFDPLEPTPFVIGRLLEDGDSADLRWLCRLSGEEKLANWMSERADRQLSTRSRAFWSLVLSETEPADTNNPLWPL